MSGVFDVAIVFLFLIALGLLAAALVTLSGIVWKIAGEMDRMP